MARAKSYKPPNRVLKLQTNLENAINEAKKYSGMERSEVCKSMKMCNATLWSRLQTPDNFTLGELRVIAMLSGKDFSEFLSELVK